MAEPDPAQPPRPGPNEIILTPPAPRDLCSSLEHRRAGRPAQVVVTLGPMGAPGQYRQAVWMQSWGKSYPLCAPCWDATRQVAQARRPNLIITGTTRAPTG
jgi:hypothetical protein